MEISKIITGKLVGTAVPERQKDTLNPTVVNPKAVLKSLE